jgi:DNA-binding IclR family transcriptional regulator
MTRAHVAQRLLALGPLSFREFVAITGWPARACSRTLNYLNELGLAARTGRTWRLS